MSAAAPSGIERPGFFVLTIVHWVVVQVYFNAASRAYFELELVAVHNR